MNSNSQQLTEIELEQGTLFVDTETRESILVEDEKQITSVDVDGGTLYIDTSTRESILVEDSEESPEASSETVVA